MGLLTPGQYFEKIAEMGGDVRESSVDDYLKQVVRDGGRTLSSWQTANARARWAAYFAANREKLRAKDAAYHADNRERILARMARYYAANREKALARQVEYRARKKAEKERSK